MKNKLEWYAYIYPKNHELFEQPKLISQLLSKSNRFSLDEEGKFYFVAVGGNCITFKEEYSDSYSMLYLLGLLNSSVLTFILKHLSPVHEGGFYLYIYNFIKRLPLVIDVKDDIYKKELIDTVKEILSYKNFIKKSSFSKNVENSKSNENEVNFMKSFNLQNKELNVDELVYKIFNLSEKEISVINEFNQKY